MDNKRTHILIRLALLLVLVAVLWLPGGGARAATCNSQATGNWSSTGTWDCGVVPTASDVVVITSGNTVTLDTAGLAASLTVDGTLIFSGSNSLTVSGDVTINTTGSLTLGTAAGGDLKLTGNWFNDDATFNPNGRAVWFNGSADQRITNNNAAATFAYYESFDYLVVDKSAGNLILGDAINQGSITINGKSGDVLDIRNTGGIDLNGSVLLLNGSASSGSNNIRVCGGARTITGKAGSKFTMNSPQYSTTRTVTNTSGGCGGTGSLVFGSNVLVTIESVDDPVNIPTTSWWLYGKFDPGNGLTTINGTLKISQGGFVVNNSPKYTTGSTLNYDTGSGGNYDLGSEWAAGSALSTAGVPYNVSLTTTNTYLGFTDDASRTVVNDLTIGADTYLVLPSLCSTTCALTVKHDWINNGGTFTPNGQKVVFDGPALQTIKGTAVTTFYDLEINNANDVLLGKSAALDNELLMTAGSFDLDFYNFTIGAFGFITNASPGETHMVIADDGKLCKTFSGIGITPSFNYIIGDHLVPLSPWADQPAPYNNYARFVLTLPTGNYNAYQICVRTRNDKHPNIGSTVTSDFIIRWWNVTRSGSGPGTFAGTFYYDNRAVSTGDVVGTEANMYGAQFNPNKFGSNNGGWTWYDPVNTTSHYFNAGSGTFPAYIPMLSTADYTALPKGPTAATMASMQAVPSAGKVAVRWTTALELNTTGFKVFRSTKPDASDRVQISSGLIPSQAVGQIGGASYEYVDATAQPATNYYYWIEEFEPGGSTFFGPLAVTWQSVYLPILAR